MANIISAVRNIGPLKLYSPARPKSSHIITIYRQHYRLKSRHDNKQLVNLPKLTETIEKRKQIFMDRLLQLDYFTVVLNVYSANVFLRFYLLLLFYHVYKVYI